MKVMGWGVLLCVWATPLLANPYPDPTKVPVDGPVTLRTADSFQRLPLADVQQEGIEVFRVEVAWDSASDTFKVDSVTREKSGTPALLKRSKSLDQLGSYQGAIIDRSCGCLRAFDSVGTGKEFRKLTRTLTFRFPVQSGDLEFRLTAENPRTGKMEEVLKTPITIPTTIDKDPSLPALEIRELQKAAVEPSLKVVVYADGYKASRRSDFFAHADRVVQALKSSSWPGLERFELQAVFAESKLELGAPKKLGLPVADRDSHLGMYYPYWNPFGRWYNVVYPTSEAHYRKAIGQVPYDYPIVLIDDNHYWGVGNYNELTAIPARQGSFTYLLTHEFGHFFGLNEEYEGGGPTELEFAPEIEEPWSQNISFLRDGIPLKWQRFVTPGTAIPTSTAAWSTAEHGPLGAYPGGYADSEPLHQSHKPVMECTMASGGGFCDVCKNAIKEKILWDLGERNQSLAHTHTHPHL